MHLRRYNLVAITALLIAGAAILISQYVKPTKIYDEGFVLTAALRMMAGDIPNRDYWATYPPGAPSVLALIFTAFKPSLALARVIDSAWTIVLYLAIYCLGRRFASFRGAALILLVLAVPTQAALYTSYPVTPALGFAFLSVALAMQALSLKSEPRAVAAGLLGGLVVIFRHDFAAYLCIATVATSVAIFWLRPDSRATAERRILLTYGASLIGLVIVLLAAMVLIAGADAFFDQLFIVPATIVHRTRHLPVPGLLAILAGKRVLNWAMAWLPPFILVLTFLRYSFVMRRLTLQSAWGILVLMSFGTLLLAQAYNRLDPAHSWPSNLAIELAALGLMATFRQGQATSGRSAAWVAVTTGFMALFICAVTIEGELHDVQGCDRRLDETRCFGVRPDEKAAADMVATMTAPQERIFVGNTRHDSIFINDALLYFLAQRLPAVRWNELHPGVATTAKVQQQIIDELRRQATRVIVLVDIPPSDEANDSAMSSNVTLLDEYIASHYRTVKVMGIYRVLESKSATGQPASTATN